MGQGRGHNSPLAKKVWAPQGAFANCLPLRTMDLIIYAFIGDIEYLAMLDNP
jgi:hypothetical protein